MVLRRKVKMIFPRSHVQDVIQEHGETLTSLDYISKNITKEDLKFRFELEQV